MCGFAGWVDFERDLRSERHRIDAMAATLACRGPDDRGTWVAPHCALGHRRLVVVDPQAGRQPMVRERDGRRFVIVYNGELYTARGNHQPAKPRGPFRDPSSTPAAWGYPATPEKTANPCGMRLIRFRGHL